MYWRIEKIEKDKIYGWAYSPENTDLDLEIIALRGNDIVGRTFAKNPCPSLKGSEHTKPDSAFTLCLKNGADSQKVTLLCMNSPLSLQPIIIHSPNKDSIGRLYSSYQSFQQDSPDGLFDGHSNSLKKLFALSLPSLKGMSVLDLGCNEGFFCQQAWLAGAQRVLGIDASNFFIEMANKRLENIFAEGQKDDRKLEFQCSSWWDIPNEKYDLILFLSAMHYEEEPAKLLSFLKHHLKDDGRLILECGVLNKPGKVWEKVTRSIDKRYFPSEDYLIDVILKDYAVRYVQNSVDQGGDSVPRKVYLCTAKKPIMNFIRGGSGSGKTILAREFTNKGFKVISSDSYLWSIIAKKPDKNMHPVYKKLHNELKTHHMHKASRLIKEADGVEIFCQDFADFLDLNLPLTMIEGQLFTDETLFDSIKKELKKRGVYVWSTDAQQHS